MKQQQLFRLKSVILNSYSAKLCRNALSYAKFILQEYYKQLEPWKYVRDRGSSS